jgi:hypothetical protein
MSAEPVFEPDRVVAALNAARVEYVIVGGLAVGAHGVVRATRDVDVVPAPDRPNMDRLAECLRTLAVAPVCSLAHLRAMKRAANRPRDRVDLAELEELHGPA